MTRREFGWSAAGLAVAAAAAGNAPAPYGVLPSRRQLRWHEMEFYGFLHFTVNTFTDKEWGYGDESPSLFHPTAFDADAIVSGLKASGMKGVILTCKHHDGFCLWPTKTTEHSVRKSPWRGGRGDVVKEISAAAARQGLKFGVYLSPWDRNSAYYGQSKYVEIYRAQLQELLTGYGPVFEVWHDGANGGDGYYGGAREKRLIDKKSYYRWPETWALVRKLQPQAVIFSDIGPDLRWVGNEKGFASETSWATYEPVGEDGGPATVGYSRWKEAGQGHRSGTKWLPAECDVSIRPGWFWHQAQNARVKTPEQILDLYFRSVGRGGSLLLNVPPDRRGLLDEADVTSLRGFGRLFERTFRVNVAAGARLTASNVRGGNDAFGARNLVDGNRFSYWATDDAVRTPSVELDFGRRTKIGAVRIRENLRLGQRVESIELDAWRDGGWRKFAGVTSIGACRLIPADGLVTNKVRLRVTGSAASPALSEVAVFEAVEGAGS